MTYTPPKVTQDFDIIIPADAVKGGGLVEEAIQELTRMFIGYTYRFLPQITPGKPFTMKITMETER